MTASLAPAPATSSAGSTPARARSLYAQAIYDTSGRVGARVGLAWILFVATLGVFAPFIANSHPIYMRQRGVWSSPMLKHLSWADLSLVWIYLSVIVMVLLRCKLKTVLVWTIFTVSVIFWFLLERPLLAHAANGDWWSPLLYSLMRPWQYRPWGDVGLLGGFAVLVGSICVVFKGFFRAMAAAFFGLILGLLLTFVIVPPSLVDYQRYRDAEKFGVAEHVIRTVIPFSPSDRQRDTRGKFQSVPPSTRNWFGTTPNSEDVASRMIHACRIATSIGFISTGISLVIGVLIGALMGYFAGKVDILGMRLIEIFESIPQLLLLIMLVAFYGRNLYMMMALIGLTTWTGKARFVRAEFLKLRKQDFVQAAVALGLPLRSILFRHILPNGLTPLIVSTSFGVASAILLESTLSFLGLGLEEEPSWGQLLDLARGNGTSFQWWLAVFPGGVIFLTVFAYNVIGESVRDALDPKLRKRD